MLSRRARLTVPGLALAGITVLTGAAAQGPASVAAQVRAAEQPQLQAIEAPAAWQLSRGRGVTVAVLDTGVDATAADLAGSVTTGPDYTLGADPPGYQPPHLHGTFIASLIAGQGSGPGDAAASSASPRPPGCCRSGSSWTTRSRGSASTTPTRGTPTPSTTASGTPPGTAPR